MRRLAATFVVCLLVSGGDSFAASKKSKRAAAVAAARKKAKSSNKSKVDKKLLEPLPDAPEPAAAASPPSRGPTRIDFDDRLIQGQTNRSGAVYLYDRKELKIKSMLSTRESFLQMRLSAP